MANYYEMMGLDRNADSEIITLVYRKLAQKFHPDRNKDSEAPQIMAEINQAYETLIDPVRRKAYDLMLYLNGNDEVGYEDQNEVPVEEPELTFAGKMFFAINKTVDTIQFIIGTSIVVWLSYMIFYVWNNGVHLS